MPDPSDPNFDPYAAAAQRDTQVAAANVMNAALTPAEKAAESQRAAAVLGVPALAIRTDPQFATQQLAGRTTVQALQNAPATARWLADDPENAAVAHDQVGPLGEIERAWNTFGERASAGFATAAPGIGHLLDRAAEWSGEKPVFGPIGEKIGGAFSTLESAYAKRPQLGGLAGQGVGVLGDLFPAVAAAITGGSGAVGAVFAGQGNEAAAQAGVGEGGQTANAALQGALGMLPVGEIAEGLVPALRSEVLTSAAKLGVGTVAQAGVGATMAAGQNVIEGKPVDQDMLQSAGFMGALHVLTHAPGVIADTAKALSDQRGATQEGQQLDQVAEAVRSTGLADRSPDRLATWAKGITGDKPAFVDAPALVKYAQSLPEDEGRQFIQDTGASEQLEPALATGSKIAIPGDVLMSKIMPTPAWDALKGDITLNQEGLTPNEAAQAPEPDEQIATAGDQVLKSAAADAEAARPEQAVYATALEQLQAANVPRREATQLASILSARYAARADRLGTDAETEFQRAGAGEGLSFAQGGGDIDTRGSITLGGDGSTIIRHMGGRDASTIPHELAHAFLEELRADAARDDAPQQLKDDYAAVAQHLGFHDLPSDQPIPSRGQEPFARGFEQYLMEGRAPSSKLRGVFGRFKAWLGRIYGNTSALNAPVTDGLRGIYGRLLATDAEIRSAEQRDGVVPDFESAADAGMTDAEFSAYQRAVGAAKTSAREKLMAKAMSTIKASRTAEWKEERKTLRANVAADVDGRPDVRAYHYLTRGELLGAEEQPPATKLDRADVREAMGSDEAVKRLPRGILADKGGAHPDDVAELTGHATGQEMLGRLAELQDFKRDAMEVGDKRSLRDILTDTETDSAMAGKHGDPLADGSIHDAATDAIHDDLRAKVLGIEQRVLEKQAGEPAANWTADALKAYAEGQIGKLKTSELRPALYLQAERRAAKEVQRALLGGNKVDALAAKRRQVISFHMYRAAREAEDELGVNGRLFARLAKRDASKSISQPFFNQISGLLSRFGFRNPPNVTAPSFAEFAESQALEGVTVVAPMQFRADVYRTPYDQMSIEEGRDLAATVKSLAHLGRLDKVAIVNGRREELEALAQEVADNVARSKVKIAEDNRATRPTNQLRAARATLLRFEAMMDMMDLNDPNGPFNRVLAHGASDANAMEHQLQKDFLGNLHEAYEAVPWSERKHWYRQVDNSELLDPQSNKPMRFTKADVIGMALNSGTEDNWQKLVGGFGWDEGAAKALIDRNLSANDFKFVQSIWDALDPLFPRMADTEERLTGVRPTKIPARPVDTPYGELKGGYYPLKYDNSRNPRLRRTSQETLETAFGRKMTGAATLNGSAQERTNFRGPLKLSPEGVIFGHMRDVTKRIAWAEYVQTADRFLKNPTIERAVNERLGPEFHDQMLKYVRTSVGYNLFDERSLAWAERFMRTWRTNGVTAIAGFNPRILFEHTAAHAQSISILGKEAWAKGMLEYFRDPIGKGQFVFDRSPEMVTRKEQANREIADLLQDIEQHADLPTKIAAHMGINPAIVAKAREIPHMPVSFANLRLVAMPTWIGGYRKALGEGMSEEDAIRYADKAVRVAHASGAPKDLPAAQQGNEFYRAFTTFFSFHLNQWNLYERATEGLRQASTGKDYGRSLESFIWALPMAAMTGALLSGRHPNDLDPKDWEAWAIDTNIRALWSGLPVARNVGDAGMDVLEGKASPRDAAMHMAPTTLTRPVQSSLQLGEDAVRGLQRATGDPNAKDSSSKWLQHAIEAPGYWFGLPLAAPARSAQYAKDLATGQQQPTNPLEAGEGLLFGPPPTKH